MLDRAIGFAGAIGVQWLKAESLVGAHPRLALILWCASVGLGVWL